MTAFTRASIDFNIPSAERLRTLAASVLEGFKTSGVLSIFYGPQLLQSVVTVSGTAASSSRILH